MHSSTSPKDECSLSAARLGGEPAIAGPKMLPHFILEKGGLSFFAYVTGILKFLKQTIKLISIKLSMWLNG